MLILNIAQEFMSQWKIQGGRSHGMGAMRGMMVGHGRPCGDGRRVNIHAYGTHV